MQVRNQSCEHLSSERPTLVIHLTTIFHEKFELNCFRDDLVQFNEPQRIFFSFFHSGRNYNLCTHFKSVIIFLLSKNIGHWPHRLRND